MFERYPDDNDPFNAGYNCCYDKLIPEIDRLRAQASMWEARCLGALSMVPGAVTLGELRDAAKRVGEMLVNEQETNNA